MNKQKSKTVLWRRVLVCGCVAALGAALAVRERAAQQAPSRPEPRAVPLAHERPSALPKQSLASRDPVAPAPSAAQEELPDPPALVGEDGSELVQPHPASAERAALIPPWAAFEEVYAALDARDFERARSLLASRQADDPRRADWIDFYSGLEIMAECLESPGAASKVRAERFIQEYRISPLRRHVRRACVAAGPRAVFEPRE